MVDIIKVFDISTGVSENKINEVQRKNILDLFTELGKEGIYYELSVKLIILGIALYGKVCCL